MRNASNQPIKLIVKALTPYTFILCFALFVTLMTNVQAQSPRDIEKIDPESTAGMKKAFKLLRDAYRSERKKNAQVYHKQKDVLDPYSGLCIECEKLTEFTNQVNAILAELPETNEHSQTQIAELMAHSAYTELTQENDHQARCFKQIQTGLTQEYKNIDADDALVIYRGEMDLTRVRSFSLFGDQTYKRSVFLRGKRPDADKLIRVDLNPDEKPVVTLYQLQEDTSDIYALQREKIKASLPSFAVDEKNREDSASARENRAKEDFYTRAQKEHPEEVDPLAAQVSTFDMEYSSSGLPKKITLLDFRDRSKLTENFEIESDIEISSDDQEMIVGLARTGKASMAQMKIEKEGDVELAFDMNLPAGIVQSQFLIGDEGAGAQFNLNHSKNSRTQLTHTTSQRSTSIEHSTDFGNRSRLSVSLRRSNGQESGHIEYKMVF